MQRFFDEPTQVKFFDENGTVNYGIAYGGEIICACCGGIFSIDEIYEFATQDEPIKPLSWADFRYAIEEDI